ncbi:hypothetical protein ACKKBG_A28060 [Auxenochlorella protothecoides x Auxenochlorella symbiontica]
MARSWALSLLCVAAVAGVALAQTMYPSQCDPTTVLTPGDLSILGPEQFLVAGGVNNSYHMFNTLNITEPVRPLLLLNGMGATQYEWPPSFLAWLSQGSRPVVTLDHAGIGGSTFLAATAPSIPLLTENTAAFMAALSAAHPDTLLPEYDVLGYSMGAMVAQSLAASFPSSVHAVVSVAGSFGGPLAPQPEGGLAATLARLVDAQLGSSQADLTLFFPLGALDPAYCSLWNAVASLQYAVGALQMPGAGYALGTVVKNPLVLLKTRAALEAQAAAVLAYYEGFCAAGWPAQLEALCPRSTAASQALGKGPVPIAFHGGSADKVIPAVTQTYSALQSPDYLLVEVPEAGHGIIYNFDAEDVANIFDYLDAAQPLSGGRPDSGAASSVTGAAGPTLAAAAAAHIATHLL